MNHELIEKSFQSIRSVLDDKVEQGDIDGAQNKLLTLQSLSGLSAELIRNCELEILTKQGELIDDLIGKKLSPTILEIYLRGKMPYEVASLTYAKKLNEAISSSIDGLRTIISLYKAEMDNSLKR